MSSRDHAVPARDGRAAIELAFSLDPALLEEVTAIAALLKPAMRKRFWSALAEEVTGKGRPAGAVLVALERTIAGGE